MFGTRFGEDFLQDSIAPRPVSFGEFGDEWEEENEQNRGEDVSCDCVEEAFGKGKITYRDCPRQSTAELGDGGHGEEESCDFSWHFWDFSKIKT